KRTGTAIMPPPGGGDGRPTAPVPTEAPLTESQMEIWLSARLSDEANCAYNESFTIRLRGELKESALRESVQELVDRHDALRITFDPKHSRLRAQERLELEIPLIELANIPTEQRERYVDELIQEDATQPFDLVAGPLVRFKLLRLEDRHHWLVVTTHHIVCDGWSTNVLIDELGTIYNAKCDGRSWSLP